MADNKELKILAGFLNDELLEYSESLDRYVLWANPENSKFGYFEPRRNANHAVMLLDRLGKLGYPTQVTCGTDYWRASNFIPDANAGIIMLKGWPVVPVIERESKTFCDVVVYFVLHAIETLLEQGIDLLAGGEKDN